jgi:protein-disulfide isomerase
VEGTEDLTRSLLSQPAGDGTSSPVPVGDPTALDAPPVQVALVGINRGSEDALVKVVEMSDYGCGYCRQFHQESFPTLKREFIETGMVEWKFVPYITGMFNNSLAATEAADCTYVQSAEAFERLNGRLWEEQSEWKNSSEPEGVVRGWVSELGIDMGVFDSCLAEDRQVPRIASATTLARQIGVRGTPTFVVIGWPPVQGALPLEMFQSLLGTAHAQLVADTTRASGAGEG